MGLTPLPAISSWSFPDTDLRTFFRDDFLVLSALDNERCPMFYSLVTTEDAFVDGAFVDGMLSVQSEPFNPQTSAFGLTNCHLPLHSYFLVDCQDKYRASAEIVRLKFWFVRTGDHVLGVTIGRRSYVGRLSHQQSRCQEDSLI